MASKHSLVIDPEALPLAANHWHLLVVGLLGGLLLFLPAAFGTVEAWSTLVALGLAATLTFFLAARIAFDLEFQLARTWLYLPLVLFLSLVAFQIAPLGSNTLRKLSPSTVSTREELLGETLDPADSVSLSFYPLATKENLRLVLIGAVVFVTVASVFRRTHDIKTVLTIVFLIGCAEGVLALLQILTRTGSIYWAIPLRKDGLVTSGSFVNYSNFSQFMNLSLAAGLALLLIRTEEQQRHEMHGVGWAWTARRYWEKNAWICAGIVLCALAVFASMSRNGAISTIVAAVAVGCALFQRRSLSWRGWFIGIIPAAVLGALLVFGFDVVYERLSTLSEHESYNLRWEMTRAAVRAWQQYPVWGTGLGTHEMVYPLFERSLITSVAAHADNDYAQLLEETGLVGVIIVAAFLAGVVTLIVKTAIRGRKPVSMGVYGIMFGLVAVAIHSATDFGQRLPANLSLSALLCSLVVAISRIERGDVRSPPERHGSAFRKPMRFAMAAAAVVGLAAVWFWVIRAAYAAHIAERWRWVATAIESRIDEKQADTTDDDYVDLIAAAEAAFKYQPENVVYGYWLNSYRWQSLSRPVASDGSPVLLHPNTMPFVARIADELSALRGICVTYGPPYALEGELRFFILKESSGRELIRKGVRLAPYDAATCLVAGELAAREGNLEDAQSLLARAIALDSAYFNEVANLYVNELKRPDLARTLAKDNYQRLGELVKMMAARPEFANEVPKLRAEAEAALRQRANDGMASSNELASLAAADLEHGEIESAIKLYRQALGQEYQQVGWRLSLARALAKHNEIEEAIHEVKIVLRLRPRDSQATKLLEELSLKSEGSRTRGKPG